VVHHGVFNRGNSTADEALQRVPARNARPPVRRPNGARAGGRLAHRVRVGRPPGCPRAFLPWAVRDYVNRTLDRNPLYEGKIGDVQIHLWRGAYSIQMCASSKSPAMCLSRSSRRSG